MITAFEFAPVTCEGGCEYSNACTAEAAGFTGCTPEGAEGAEGETADTADDCPVPDPSVPCTKEEKPVMCEGDCEYSNECLGEAAGFTDCEDMMEQAAADGDGTTTVKTEKSKEDTTDDCPVPSGSTVCTADFNPVSCPPDDCEYSNSCLAEAAGFTDCVAVEGGR